MLNKMCNHNFNMSGTVQSFNNTGKLKGNRSKQYKNVKLFVLPYLGIYMFHERRNQQHD